jgi:hypothetical protein
MLNVVNSLAIVNVVFLFVLLILRKNNSTPNKVLAFLFLVPGLYFVSNLLIINNWIDSFPIVFFCCSNSGHCISGVDDQICLSPSIRYEEKN